jgi:hypothetical protein
MRWILLASVLAVGCAHTTAEQQTLESQRQRRNHCSQLRAGCATPEEEARELAAARSRDAARAEKVSIADERAAALRNVERIKRSAYQACAAEPPNVDACAAVVAFERENEAQAAARRDRWLSGLAAGALVFQMQQAALAPVPAPPRPAPVSCTSTTQAGITLTNCR